jgi:hypothetical protein
VTSPRTPRQWAAWSEEPSASVQKLVDRDGNLVGRDANGNWLYLTVDGKAQDDSCSVPWSDLDDEYDMGWPLSEVLPETPEPPREDDKIYPTWTDETVAALNDFQHRGGMHPFTCPGSHDRETVLIATSSGWMCPRGSTCGYTQGWAHSFMADRSAWPTCPFPASQSVPAVPVSSTGGKETGEGDETATGAEALSGEPKSWLAGFIYGFAGNVSQGDAGVAAAEIIDEFVRVGWRPPLPDCGCQLFDFCEKCWGPEQQREFEIRQLAYCEASVQASADPEDGEQCSNPRKPGSIYCERHTPSPLPDSETEWGWRNSAGDCAAYTERAARRYVKVAPPNHRPLVLIRRAVGPWIEVTS